MKKSMGFMILMLGVLGGSGWASDGTPDTSDRTMVAHLPVHPLMMLPGMRQPALGVPAAPISAFPTPIISDVINAPNPFDSRKSGLNGMTQLSYVLANNYPVTITLYDLLGRRVRDWSFRAGEAGGRQGTNQLLWDGTNESGQKVSKGGYLAQIEVDSAETHATVLRKIGVIH